MAGIAAREALRLLTKVRRVAAAAVLQRASGADERIRRRARVGSALVRVAGAALELARRHVAARLARRLRRPELAARRAAVRRVAGSAHVRVAEGAARLALAHRLRARRVARKPVRRAARRVAARRALLRVVPRILRRRAAAGRRPSGAVVRVRHAAEGSVAHALVARRARGGHRNGSHEGNDRENLEHCNDNEPSHFRYLFLVIEKRKKIVLQLSE